MEQKVENGQKTQKKSLLGRLFSKRSRVSESIQKTEKRRLEDIVQGLASRRSGRRLETIERLVREAGGLEAALFLKLVQRMDPNEAVSAQAAKRLEDVIESASVPRIFIESALERLDADIKYARSAKKLDSVYSSTRRRRRILATMARNVMENHIGLSLCMTIDQLQTPASREPHKRRSSSDYQMSLNLGTPPKEDEDEKLIHVANAIYVVENYVLQDSGSQNTHSDS